MPWRRAVTTGHDLERFLVRILFCLFAQCTGIFEREAFRLFIEDRTKPDGSDLGVHLEQLFAVLNTPANKRQKNLDETLAAFPYVNGELFAERLGFAEFQSRHAQQPAGMYAVRLVADFAGHFRFAVPGNDAAQGAAAIRQPLHERARHPQSGAGLVPGRPAGGIRADQGQQEPTQAIPPEDCRASFSRPGLRLRQFSRDHVSRTAVAGNRGPQAPGKGPAAP